MRTQDNLYKHELIGLNVKIIESTNKSLIGIHGKVVDETRNTISIESDNIEKQIPKKTTIFHFQLPDNQWLEIDGKILVSRPEDRLKKKFRKI